MGLLESGAIALGTAAPAFDLPNIDDVNRNLDSFSEAKALVVMFICNHCPYVVAVEDRLVSLAAELQPRGAAFVGIMSNDVARYPADAPEKMKQRAAERGFPFPYLYDGTQAVAKAYGAVCTPDIFVFDADRKLAYHGRLDDSWKDPSKVTKRDLKEAVIRLLEGKAVSADQVPSMGCSIKWRD